MNAPTIIVPRETLVSECANEAAVRGLHLITDGKDTLISPVVLPGWFRVGVRVKPQPAHRSAA